MREKAIGKWRCGAGVKKPSKLGREGSVAAGYVTILAWRTPEAGAFALDPQVRIVAGWALVGGGAGHDQASKWESAVSTAI
jgi:hypothetical protein